jgi:hypothetical protein
MFYDTANACDPTAKEPLSRRPYLTKPLPKFLKKLLTKGVDVPYLQPLNHRKQLARLEGRTVADD